MMLSNYNIKLLDNKFIGNGRTNVAHTSLSVANMPLTVMAYVTMA